MHGQRVPLIPITTVSLKYTAPYRCRWKKLGVKCTKYTPACLFTKSKQGAVKVQGFRKRLKAEQGHTGQGPDQEYLGNTLGLPDCKMLRYHHAQIPPARTRSAAQLCTQVLEHVLPGIHALVDG